MTESTVLSCTDVRKSFTEAGQDDCRDSSELQGPGGQQPTVAGDQLAGLVQQ